MPLTILTAFRNATNNLPNKVEDLNQIMLSKVDFIEEVKNRLKQLSSFLASPEQSSLSVAALALLEALAGDKLFEKSFINRIEKLKTIREQKALNAEFINLLNELINSKKYSEKLFSSMWEEYINRDARDKVAMSPINEAVNAVTNMAVGQAESNPLARVGKLLYDLLFTLVNKAIYDATNGELCLTKPKSNSNKPSSLSDNPSVKQSMRERGIPFTP